MADPPGLSPTPQVEAGQRSRQTAMKAVLVGVPVSPAHPRADPHVDCGGGASLVLAMCFWQRVVFWIGFVEDCRSPWHPEEGLQEALLQGSSTQGLPGLTLPYFVPLPLQLLPTNLHKLTTSRQQHT